MCKKRELYKKISSRKGKGVKIKPNLCFYNPEEVYRALTQNRDVVKWLNFISNHYLPPKNKKVLLIFPCSTEKPYHKSRSYKILFKTLEALGKQREAVHLVTISEPFGLVPEEFYESKNEWHDWKNEWYDCPGLFKWWCDKYNQPYSYDYVDKCIEYLAGHVARFLLKVKSKKCYSKIIAFIRTCTSKLETKNDHTHRRIIERAAEISKVHVEILPKSSVVSKIVRINGRMAWDMYGVAHPLAQEYLLQYLKGVLDDARN
jgi:archaeosine synthase